MPRMPRTPRTVPRTPRCLALCKDPIQSHTQLNRAIHGYTGLYIAIVTGLYTIIQGYTQVYRATHSLTELYTAIQNYAQIYRDV